MLENKLQSLYSGAKSAASSALSKAAKFVAPVVAAAAMYAPMQSDAATTISSNIFQTYGLTRIDYTVVNNNPTGTIFNSASVNFADQYDEILQWIYTNTSYGTITDLVNDNKLSFGIDPGSAEELVNMGWEVNLNPSTGYLNFTNNGLDPDIDYDVFRTTADGNPNTLKYTVNFGNIFDYNESTMSWYGITGTPNQSQDAWEGVVDAFNSVYADMPRYQMGGIVPEPSKTVLLGIAALALLSRRQRKALN
jgi:hypothetical protein